MNYLPILLLGFSKYKTAELSIFVKNVIAMMTGNVHFPNLQDKVTELQTAFDLFMQSIVAPELQNEKTRDILKMNRQKLILELKSLGNLIMGEAVGNIEKLMTTGYKLREKPTARPVPTEPINVEVFMTNTQGVIVVSCKKVEGADSYIARLSPDKVTWNWTNFENGSKVMVENIPTNQVLYVQMRAKNAAGRSDWSNIIETYLPSKDIPVIKKMNVSVSKV